jgi:hypothetical protein
MLTFARLPNTCTSNRLKKAMKSRSAQVAVFVFLACLQAGADAAESKSSPDQQRIRVLVNLLASKNTVSGRSIDQFPKHYDRNAQVVVYLAAQQLLAEGATAFDTLIEHLDDKRYSYTYAAADAEYNKTVGDVCCEIMLRCIKCYCNELYYITNEQFNLEPRFPGDSGVAKWWHRNRRRPLWEIQVAAIDRAIELMEKVRRDKTRVPWRLAEQLTPEVFESRRKENLRILKEMRASIVANEEAYRPQSLEKWRDDPYDAMLGLPWPTNPNRF